MMVQINKKTVTKLRPANCGMVWHVFIQLIIGGREKSDWVLYTR